MRSELHFLTWVVVSESRLLKKTLVTRVRCIGAQEGLFYRPLASSKRADLTAIGIDLKETTLSNVLLIRSRRSQAASSLNDGSSPPGMLFFGERPTKHTRNLRNGRPPACNREYEHHQLCGINVFGDYSRLLTFKDSGSFIVVERPAQVFVWYFIVKHQRLPAEKTDELRSLAMVVIDTPCIVADILCRE